jgi:hypothetical protein
LKAAADALLAWSLAGRRTDDELLGTVLAPWDEFEDAMVHGDERLVQQGITGWRAQTQAMLREVEAWRKRYRLAWRRWLTSRPSTAPRPVQGSSEAGRGKGFQLIIRHSWSFPWSFLRPAPAVADSSTRRFGDPDTCDPVRLKDWVPRGRPRPWLTV